LARPGHSSLSFHHRPPPPAAPRPSTFRNSRWRFFGFESRVSSSSKLRFRLTRYSDHSASASNKRQKVPSGQPTSRQTASLRLTVFSSPHPPQLPSHPLLVPTAHQVPGRRRPPQPPCFTSGDTTSSAWARKNRDAALRVMNFWPSTAGPHIVNPIFDASPPQTIPIAHQSPGNIVPFPLLIPSS